MGYAMSASSFRGQEALFLPPAARSRPPLGHEGLMTLALKVEAAARDGDPARLRAEAARFVEALEDHLAAEVPRFLALTPSDARILERGQRRLRAAIRLLLQQSKRDCDERAGGSTERAQELKALLELQVLDEHRALSSAA